MNNHWHGFDIVVMGEVDTPELAAAFGKSAQGLRTRRVKGVDEFAAAVAAGDATPQLIVAAVSRPGKLTREQLQHIRQLAPTTPLVAVVGSWFEGDRRPAARDLGVPIYYWHQWQGMSTAAISAAQRGDLPRWVLPATYAVDETIAFPRRHVGHRRISNPGEGVLVAVYGEDDDAVAVLVDLLADHGYRAVGANSLSAATVSEPAAVVCDLSSLADTQLRLVDQALAAYPQASILVNVSFPRWQDVAHFRHLGVSAIFAKPFTNDDFLGQLGVLLTSAPAAAIDSAA